MQFCQDVEPYANVDQDPPAGGEIKDEAPDYDAGEEDNDDEDKAPAVEPDHEPIKGPKDDDDDDDDKGPDPSSGGAKCSRFNKATSSSSALGALSKAPPEQPNSLEAMDDLGIPENDEPFLDSTDYDYPEMMDRAYYEHLEEQEPEPDPDSGDSEKDSMDEEYDAVQEDRHHHIQVDNEFSGSDASDFERRYAGRKVDLHNDLDERRLRAEKQLPNFRILIHEQKFKSQFFSHAFTSAQDPRFVFTIGDHASPCAKCGVFMCFACRFNKINDEKSVVCSCSSAYWTSSPASMLQKYSYEDVFVDDYVVDAENKIVLRSRGADLTEEYNDLKDANVRKFDYQAGPFAIAEETGIFTLGPVLQRTYYQPNDLSFEEFNWRNSGLGYPLRVIDYETWKELDKPEDNDDYIHHQIRRK